MSPERKLTHAAAVKARYHARKAADLCVGCEVKRNVATKDRRTA